MCGRFVLFTTDLDERYGLVAPFGLPPARYNIAPTQKIAIVHEGLIEPARWGLIPHWKKDLSGPPLFNARAETVATKPSFRDAFRAGRCLVPMDGYFEWKDKQPYFVAAPEGLLWAAGLYARGSGDPRGAGMTSATIVTTAATAEMEWLHGRLPKFLTDSEREAWLAGENLLEPSAVSGFRIHPVDRAVGNVKNDYPELIASVQQTSE